MHRSVSRFAVAVSSATLIAALLLPAGAALAASCKEITSQSACEKRTDCTWVKGYTRKDGAKVKAYCRSKGGHSKKKTTKSSKEKPTGSSGKSEKKTR